MFISDHEALINSQLWCSFLHILLLYIALVFVYCFVNVNNKNNILQGKLLSH